MISRKVGGVIISFHFLHVKVFEVVGSKNIEWLVKSCFVVILLDVNDSKMLPLRLNMVFAKSIK